LATAEVASTFFDAFHPDNGDKPISEKKKTVKEIRAIMRNKTNSGKVHLHEKFEQMLCAVENA
jgi:hypothetical protein